jgi:hypothetical protein
MLAALRVGLFARGAPPPRRRPCPQAVATGCVPRLVDLMGAQAGPGVQPRDGWGAAAGGAAAASAAACALANISASCKEGKAAFVEVRSRWLLVSHPFCSCTLERSPEPV